jgi:hypothetical protein
MLNAVARRLASTPRFAMDRTAGKKALLELDGGQEEQA